MMINGANLGREKLRRMRERVTAGGLIVAAVWGEKKWRRIGFSELKKSFIFRELGLGFLISFGL